MPTAGDKTAAAASETKPGFTVQSVVGSTLAGAVEAVYDEKLIRGVADDVLTELYGFIPGGRPVYNVIKRGVRSVFKTYNGKNAIEKGKREVDEKKAETMETKMKEMEAELKELKEKVLRSRL